MDQQPLIPEVLEPVDTLVEPNGELKPRYNLFQKGNPGGRTNTPAHRHRILQKIAQAHSVTLIERVICEAEAGDMLAMKIIMDRIWPKPKSIPIQVGIPATQNPDEIRKAMHQLLNEVAEGKLTTDDGQNLIAMMKNVIDTYRIDTVAPSGPGQAVGGNVKEILKEKFARALEARKNGHQSETADPA